jgi:hypothetical protein
MRGNGESEAARSTDNLSFIPYAGVGTSLATGCTAHVRFRGVKRTWLLLRRECLLLTHLRHGSHGIAAVQLDPSTPFRGRQIPAVISV